MTPEQYAVLFRATYPRVLSYARRRAPGLAEDIASEVFLVALRRGDQIPADEAEHLPWLLGVARRVLANALRAEQRTLISESHDEIEDLVAWATDHAELVVARDGALAALATLSSADREILQLVGWEGLGPEGIAVVMECSVAAAKVRLHRARKRLDEALREQDAVRATVEQGALPRRVPRQDQIRLSPTGNFGSLADIRR